MTTTYHGREGRRTKLGYKILHMVTVDCKLYEVAAQTKEQAIEYAEMKAKEK